MSPLQTTGPLHPTTTATADDTGADGTWEDPQNIFSNNGSTANSFFLDTNPFTSPLYGGTFGFNIPSNAIIDGILLEVEISSSNRLDEPSSVIKLTKAGSEVGDNKAGTGTAVSNVYSYGGSSDLWGTTWTPAEINAAGFGSSLDYTYTSSPNDFSISIDFVRITVYWHIDVAVAPADVPVRHDYKIFNQAGQFLGNLPKVISDFGYLQNINTVGSQLRVECALNYDTAGLSVPPVARGTLVGWLTGWSYRKKIVVPSTKVDGSLADFPLYVDLSALGPDFFAAVDSAGDDIRITDAYGVIELPFEIVTIDTSAKTGELWFKADSLSNYKDSVFYIYYGNASASPYAVTDSYGRNNVWSDYRAVYHLKEGGTTSANAYVDSTGNNSGGTGNGNVGDDNSAKIGKGTTFDGNNDYINIGNGSPLQITADIFISAWVKPTNFADYRGIVGKTNGGAPNPYDFYLLSSSGLPTFIMGNGSGSAGVNASAAPTTGQWNHLAVKRSGTSVTHYKNGVPNGTGTLSTTITNGAVDAYIGNRTDQVTDMLGSLDEIRIGVVVRNDAWLAAEYSNQNDPSDFYLVGGVEYEVDDTRVLIRNGNLMQVYEYNYFYPNGILVFRGQINRVEAGDTTSMLVYSDGRDTDNHIARGAPFSYTNDQTQTTAVDRVSVVTDVYGEWTRYGQSFVIGGGVTNIGRIQLKLDGIANVTVSVYGSSALGPLLGSVKKYVNVSGPTIVDFIFSDFIDVVAGESYFFTVATDNNSSIWLYFNDNGNPYANGSMYSATFAGGSGGGLYSASSNDDLYFTIAHGTPTTQASYSDKDPSTEMLIPMMDDYIDRGGLITYDEDSIEATGLALDCDFNVNTMFEATQRIHSISPSGFYFFVDVATRLLNFKRTSLTADITLIKGRHAEDLKLVFSTENVVNSVLFSGGDTGGGSNLYTSYQNPSSISLYGPRLARRSDNRVTVEATADIIGGTMVNERSDEQAQTVVKILANVMDLSLIKLGMTVGFRGYQSFIDNMVFQIVTINRSSREIELTLGTIPVRFTERNEEIVRGLIAEQTLNNPSTPS